MTDFQEILICVCVDNCTSYAAFIHTYLDTDPVSEYIQGYHLFDNQGNGIRFSFDDDLRAEAIDAYREEFTYMYFELFSQHKLEFSG